MVPTRTPTPEEPEDTEWLEQQARRALTRRKIRVKIIQEEDEEEQELEETAKKNNHKQGQKSKYQLKKSVNGQMSDTKFNVKTSSALISETNFAEESADQSLSTKQVSKFGKAFLNSFLVKFGFLISELFVFGFQTNLHSNVNLNGNLQDVRPGTSGTGAEICPGSRRTSKHSRTDAYCEGNIPHFW